MKRIGKYLLLAGFMVHLGCNTPEKVPETPKKSVAAKPKPVGDEVPESISNLLPKEKVNETNAHEQVNMRYQQVLREKATLERTESAKRD